MPEDINCLIKHHTMKMHLWPWHLMEVNGQLHTSAAIPLGGKNCWYPLDRWLGVPQSWS